MEVVPTFWFDDKKQKHTPLDIRVNIRNLCTAASKGLRT